MDLKQHIRHVPDFPKPGILFYDITTLLRDPVGLKTTIDRLAGPYAGQRIDVVVGIERDPRAARRRSACTTSRTRPWAR